MAHLQLTDRERYQIEALKKDGYSSSKIARSMGRSPSTICRELARNSDHKGYRGSLAIRMTNRRRQHAKKREKLDLAMCSMIKSLLGEYLSPEQISGRLKLGHEVEISHEIIYGHILEDKKKGGDTLQVSEDKGKAV